MCWAIRHVNSFAIAHTPYKMGGFVLVSIPAKSEVIDNIDLAQCMD